MSINPTTGEITDDRTPVFRDESEPDLEPEPDDALTVTLTRWGLTAQTLITGICIAALAIMALSQPLVVLVIALALGLRRARATGLDRRLMMTAIALALLLRQWATKGRNPR